MNPKINELLGRIHELEEEIESELQQRREALHVRIEDHKIRFERSVLARHRRLKTGLLRYLAEANLRSILSAPVIYSLIIPLVFIDAAITTYQRICFPLYGIPRLHRSEYLVFDRGQLAYLNAIEKLNCLYCSYANGLAAYLKEIAACTEQYWCPIKHARRLPELHSRYGRFVDYGDAEAYRRELERLRDELRGERPPA